MSQPTRYSRHAEYRIHFRWRGCCCRNRVRIWLVNHRVGSGGSNRSVSKLRRSQTGPQLSAHDTAYSIALTLDPDYQGLGLGRALKQAQLKAARALNEDGSPRYRSMVGRNRVGLTDSMGHLNDSFGAYTKTIYNHQYGTEAGTARYCSIPLQGFVPSKTQTRIPGFIGPTVSHRSLPAPQLAFTHV